MLWCLCVITGRAANQFLGMVVTGIFAFLLSRNEFLFALILSGPHAKTLPVVITGFNSDVGPLYNQMSAAATLVRP